MTNPAVFPTLDELVAALALARQDEQAAQDRIATLEAEQAATPLGLRLAREYCALADARTDVKTLDAEVRAAALNTHCLTGNKKPHPAVQVKTYTQLRYTDDEALTYCRAHLPQAIVTTIDYKTFEAVAKAAGLSFVTIHQETRATVAQELAAYLPQEA